MYAFWLITAAWAAGEPIDPPPAECTPAQPPQMIRVVSSGGMTMMPYYGGTQGASPGAQGTSPYHSLPAKQPTMPAAAPALMPGQVSANYAPSTQSAPVNTFIRVINSQNAVSAPADTPTKMGHEADYSRITGYLYYVHADGGRWVVRYATLDQVDRYGGSVVLIPCMEMGNFREGDLVMVRGEVISEGRTSRSLGGALYRAQVIEMIERR